MSPHWNRRVPLPDVLLFLIPLGILIGTGLYLHLHWDEIPARFPIHWGPGGAANGWSSRTFIGVYGPLLLGFAIILFILGIYIVSLWGSRRATRYRAGELVAIALSYIVAIALSMAGVMPLHIIPIRTILGFCVASLVLIATLAWLSVPKRSGSWTEARDTTPDACWHADQFYYNPQDRALFVEKRVGFGLTLNFGNRLSWIVLASIVLISAALVLVALEFTKQ